MSLATQSLFSLTNRRRFGISTISTFETSNNLIERLNSTTDQSHSLSDQYEQSASPNALYYSHDNTGLLAVGDEEGYAHIYDTIQNEFILAWYPHRSAILDIIWVPTVPKILTCSADRTIVVSDTIKHTAELSFLGHTNSVRCLDLCYDHPTTFASGGRDGQVLVWDIRYPRKNCCAYHPINSIYPFKKETAEYKHQIKVTSVKFLSDKMLATTADASHLIKIWDTRRTYTNYKRIPLPLHTLYPQFSPSLNRGYTCLTVDKSCNSIYASGLDGYIRRFSTNFTRNTELDNYYGHRANNFYIRACLSPNDHWLLSGSLCGKAHLWNVTQPGSHQYTLDCGSSSEVLAVAWSPFDIDNIVTSSDEGITFWNMKRNYEDNKRRLYKVEKAKEKMEYFQVSDKNSKRLKMSTLDNYFLKTHPDTSELLEQSTTESAISPGPVEVKSEPLEELNETKTTHNITESMQHLAVQTDVPTNSKSETSGTEKQCSISNFLFSGKGMKRKHSDDMDISS